jgi:leucine dehydrogenase
MDEGTDILLPAAPPEDIVMLNDGASGLQGVIAIHSTERGPAMGGCRMWDYPSSAAMIMDAVRLAEGMSYKNALAGLPLGGGKTVLQRHCGPIDRPALFRALGAQLEKLGGRYITAEDVGTSVADMVEVSSRTRWVSGLAPRDGQPGGDPSPWTARGVFKSMEFSVERHLGKSLDGLTVAVQGLGHVGYVLCELLHEAGARLIVSDIRTTAVARAQKAFGARAAAEGEILQVKADVFAPCALGGILDAASIAGLQASVVCGAANNQLALPEHGRLLAERDILYAPDYIVNAGGIINAASEFLGWDHAEVDSRMDRIPYRLAEVFALAEANEVPTNIAADSLARQVIVFGETSGA